jgi:hemerythrin-like domain-containing protein
MKMATNDDRRNFIIRSAALVGVAALGGAAAVAGCASKADQAEATPTEELMQDHGVLQRLLLIFEEVARRLKCCMDYPAGVLADAAALTRRYIQDHHEKLEEEHLFPRFEKAGKMLALVKILRLQHEAGWKLLDQLKEQAAPGPPKNFVQRAKLEAYLLLFTRMSRPHAAREDTVLFPALRPVMTPAEFADLGRKFAQQEEARFGQGNHDRMVLTLADQEKALGIHDLEQFTPKL